VVMELEEHQYGAGLMSERSYPWARRACGALARSASGLSAAGYWPPTRTPCTPRAWQAGHGPQTNVSKGGKTGHSGVSLPCKALAQIRKLLGPNIQINVAEKQVNVMS